MAPTTIISTTADKLVDTTKDLVLRNVLSNRTEGTFGRVVINNETASDDEILTNSTFSSDVLSSNCNFNNATLGIEPTKLGDIPAKEIIIVILMLALWVYSIILTRKAWYRILKE